MPVVIQEWFALLGDFYNQYGYLAVLLGSLGENTAILGLFLPGGTLALLGAVYAREGTLNLGWVIFWATLGTILGYHVDYLLGRFVLARTTQWQSKSRIGRRLRLTGRLRLARILLTKHGGKAILISHTIGHMRSFVALSAGTVHMRYSHFLFFEIIAALLWNILYCLTGYFVAVEINQLLHIFKSATWIMIAIFALLLLIWYIWRHYFTARAQRVRQLARRKAQMR